MRSGGALLWNRWRLGLDAIGLDGRSNGYVTVEPGWRLNHTTRAGAYKKVPVRYWYQPGAIQVSLPNVAKITWDDSVETDAAECKIDIFNQKMDPNETPGNGVVLGQPGYFTWSRGVSAAALARWGPTFVDTQKWLPYPYTSSPYGPEYVRAFVPDDLHYFSFESQLEGLGVGYIAHNGLVDGDRYFDYVPPALWANALVPNALLRTFEGYGGWDEDLTDGRMYQKPLDEALAGGFVVPTGVWLVDEVVASSQGMLQLSCRNLAKLPIEQPLMPPLVPYDQYPDGLRYCRWQDTFTTNYEPKGAQHALGASSSEVDHPPSHSFDGNPDTEWICASQSSKDAVQWIELDNPGGTIDVIAIRPWGGNYHVFASLMIAGEWWAKDPENPNSAPGGGPPYLADTGTPFDETIEIHLGDSYYADKVRLTFTNLLLRPEGDYRCGLREYEAAATSTSVTGKIDGNYTDYLDIVKDFLMWCGFYAGTDTQPDAAGGVLGNLESTGAYAEDCITADTFDKKNVIDGINTIRDIVGYHFWVDSDGIPHFESPNWWSSGNFFEDGSHTEFIPDIDERLQMTDYTVRNSDRSVRSEFVIATEDPDKTQLNTTVTTRYTPMNAAALKGIVKPLMWLNKVFTSKAEQVAMANLIAIHSWFSQRQGQVTIVANPLIQRNDQVRLWERVTSETYIHYVRGVHSELDLQSGVYKMTLTTHWLGDWPTPWAIEEMIGPELAQYLEDKPLRSLFPGRIKPLSQTQTALPAGT